MLKRCKKRDVLAHTLEIGVEQGGLRENLPLSWPSYIRQGKLRQGGGRGHRLPHFILQKWPFSPSVLRGKWRAVWILCTVNNFPHYRMTADIEAPQDEINTLGSSRTLRQIRPSQTYHVMNGERYLPEVYYQSSSLPFKRVFYSKLSPDGLRITFTKKRVPLK